MIREGNIVPNAIERIWLRDKDYVEFVVEDDYGLILEPGFGDFGVPHCRSF